jgi:hypothetical protein
MIGIASKFILISLFFITEVSVAETLDSIGHCLNGIKTLTRDGLTIYTEKGTVVRLASAREVEESFPILSKAADTFSDEKKRFEMERLLLLLERVDRTTINIYRSVVFMSVRDLKSNEILPNNLYSKLLLIH